MFSLACKSRLFEVLIPYLTLPDKEKLAILNYNEKNLPILSAVFVVGN